MGTLGAFGTSARRMAARPLPDIIALFGQWIDFSVLADRDRRCRLFPFEMTFWLFLAQCLSPRTSCADAVGNAVATLVGAGRKIPCLNTSAYCQARRRLPDSMIRAILQQVRQALRQRTRRTWLWCGLPVVIVDATQISVQDTGENRRHYQYPHGVKRGAGYPALKMLAYFSLQTGALVDYAEARCRRSEQSLFRSTWQRALRAGDVMLGDRFFCNFASFAKLAAKGIHLVVRQNATLSTSLRRVRRLGRRDHLCEWTRCRMRAAGFSAAAWHCLPKTILVRQIGIVVEVPGMRTKKIMLLTTLADRRRYPREAFGGLYRRRWNIELHFRDIKTTMGMEHIPCRTPEMVRKHLALCAIAYNLVRLVMVDAARAHRVDLGCVSFKRTVDTLRHWAPLMARQTKKPATARLYRRLLVCVARSRVPDRPGRREPRAIKARRRGYETLNKPRAQFRETAKRESWKYQKAAHA